MKLITRLLRKNMSGARIAGFILSNFAGLAIVGAGVQIWNDALPVFSSDDGVLNSDLLVVNKRVGGAQMWEGAQTFDEGEIGDLKKQPWVRDVGEFRANTYDVLGSVGGERGMSTLMFFESVPDRFVDGAGNDWRFREGDTTVPIIIPRDYLALYNFGFAGSAGLPQLSESVIGGIPLRLRMTSQDGLRTKIMEGRISGFSDRINTILVPESFMEWSNRELGDGNGESRPSRLAVDVNSPGDVAIGKYLEEHGLQVAGDKTGSQASFLLKVIVGIILGIGLVITVLSLTLLMLSVTLLMEKNRDKIRGLIQLGYPLNEIGRPYAGLVTVATAVSGVSGGLACLLLRDSYSGALDAMGGGSGHWWAGICAVAILGVIVWCVNVLVVRRHVRSIF